MNTCLGTELVTGYSTTRHGASVLSLVRYKEATTPRKESSARPNQSMANGGALQARWRHFSRYDRGENAGAKTNREETRYFALLMDDENGSLLP